MGAVVAFGGLTAVARGQSPEFVEVRALRQVDVGQLGPVLADIESRMAPGHIYRNDGNPVNWAHETTHGLNSVIRNRAGGLVNAFYVLDGRAAVLAEPRLRLSQVVALVPPEFRRDVLAPGWDDRPLYALDEWVSYTNGTACGLDREAHGLRPGPSDEVHAYGLECAIALSAYAAAELVAVERYDPGYAQRDELEQFVGWHTARVLAICERARTNSRLFWRSETAAMLAAFERRFLSDPTLASGQ